MNKTEIIKLIRVLSANYRNFPEQGKEQDTVMLWESMLDDMDYDTGRAAVKAHIARSPFPPTIADIRDSAVMLSNHDSMDAIEAWGEIVKAIRKYGFYNQAEEHTSELQSRGHLVCRLLLEKNNYNSSQSRNLL